MCAVPAHVVFNRDLFAFSIILNCHVIYRSKDKYFVVLPMLIFIILKKYTVGDSCLQKQSCVCSSGLSCAVPVYSRRKLFYMYSLVRCSGVVSLIK